MAKDQETFHLMAVPKYFVPEVLNAGGRFLKLKKKQFATKTLQLIQQNDSIGQLVHILNPSQHRDYDILGKEYEEDMSICNAVFDNNREEGYRIFKENPKLATCKECQKVLKKILEPS